MKIKIKILVSVTFEFLVKDTENEIGKIKSNSARTYTYQIY